MSSWAESPGQDAFNLCEPEGPRGPGVALQQRDAVSGQVLQEQELRWPRLHVQVILCYIHYNRAVPYTPVPVLDQCCRNGEVQCHQAMLESLSPTLRGMFQVT